LSSIQIFSILDAWHSKIYSLYCIWMS